MNNTQDHTKREDGVYLGFWIYLMSDCLLFASLFATFAVLRNNTFGGPAGSELFDLSFVLWETLILLTSSFTAGLMLYHARRGSHGAFLWGAVTLLLGVAFLFLELKEFSQLALEGNDWQRSAFLSAFFTLVGTHGLHVFAGIVWLGTLIAQTYRWGMNAGAVRRLTCFALFWHFLDVVWIFIFTIVYLMSFV